MQTPSSPSLRRRILWSAAALVVVGVLGLGAYNAVALPGCASCHDRAGFRAATAASPHAKTDCRACHAPAGVVERAGFGLGQTFHMFVPVSRPAVRDAAAVPDSRCLACHAKVEKGVTTSNGIRIDHAVCDKGASCTDCHSTTAHGEATSWVRTYDMDRCLACHVAEKKTACDLCHQGRGPRTRIAAGSFAITHGPQWKTTHGMGDPATCMVCHTPDKCIGCHGPGLPHGADFITTHPTFSKAAGAKCSGCHEQSFCDGCHGTPMPHTAEFTKGHAKLAAATPALCKRCHADSDCTECHTKHIHPGGSVGPTAKGGRTP